jgi:3-dehydroquinate synthase
VVDDLDFLATLPRREQAAGWAEVIKMGVIRSRDLFELLEASPAAMFALGAEAARAIARSIELKGEVVAADEREADLRMILNYGHTLGHAIEAATSYGRVLHGEAVAVGMRGAAEIAVRLGLFDADQRDRQSALLRAFALPAQVAGLSPSELWGPMRYDKKAVASRIRWVLPTAIGTTVTTDEVPESLVTAVMATLVHD